MLKNLLTRKNLLIALGLIVVISVIVAIVLASKQCSLREHMANIVELEYRSPYVPSDSKTDLIHDSMIGGNIGLGNTAGNIGMGTALMNNSALNPLRELEKSYPAIYRSSNIDISPQLDFQEQEFPKMMPSSVKPLEEIIGY